MFSRRRFLQSSGALAAGLVGGVQGALAEGFDLPFGNGARPVIRYPGKRPLVGTTQRPPQAETPFAVFDEGLITPNDAFFIRYHEAGIPLQIDPDTFTLSIKGAVETPLTLSLAELKGMPTTEIVAVAQCSGNSRGFFEPRVAGGQLGNGAMGNARWKGVTLKALLDKAGVKTGAVQVQFDGLDQPVLPATPKFAKALDLDLARNGEVLVAYEMNGTDLPWLNGFPVRLVVPGYYATYWVKHLNEITVLEKPLANFWMAKAYRIPNNDCHCVAPGQPPGSTVPIGRYDVRSFLTNLQDGARVTAGKPLTLRGIAFDGGYGISDVSVSIDGGQTWRRADLGEDLGGYSFRGWTTSVTPPKGPVTVLVRATNRIGQSQPMRPLWNPSGYMRNVVEQTKLMAA